MVKQYTYLSQKINNFFLSFFRIKAPRNNIFMSCFLSKTLLVVQYIHANKGTK